MISINFCVAFASLLSTAWCIEIDTHSQVRNEYVNSKRKINISMIVQSVRKNKNVKNYVDICVYLFFCCLLLTLYATKDASIALLTLMSARVVCTKFEKTNRETTITKTHKSCKYKQQAFEHAYQL